MNASMKRIPLAIAMSSVLAFAVGCTPDRDDQVIDDQAAMTADERAAQTPPAATTADGVTQGDATYGATAQDAMDDARDSDQPIDDTWITTKVKSSLLADSDVSGLDIEVETVNGVVTLSGEVAQQAQIEHATRIAREIEGVTDVVTTGLVTGAN